MICKTCGAEVLNEAKFCSECGAAIVRDPSKKTAGSPNRKADPSEVNAERVTLCKDGKYRWVYEYPMIKNPVLFFTCFKVICLCFAFPALIVFISDIGRNGLVKAFLSSAQVYCLLLPLGFVLSLLGYLIVAAGYGWKYVVVFVMDENGIDHIQQAKQVRKAQALGVVLALTGAAAKSPGRVGQGMLVASHGSLSSTFRSVKKIKGYPHSNVIKVNSMFSKNQVYMMDEDYDFVWEYITSRCPNAKISG